VRTNDFGVFVSDTPDPVSIRQPLTYSLRVVNTGPGVATGVWLTNQLPAEVEVVRVEPSQGACSVNGEQIVCELGSVDQSAVAQITVVVIPAARFLFCRPSCARRTQPG